MRSHHLQVFCVALSGYLHHACSNTLRRLGHGYGPKSTSVQVCWTAQFFDLCSGRGKTRCSTAAHTYLSSSFFFPDLAWLVAQARQGPCTVSHGLRGQGADDTLTCCASSVSMEVTTVVSLCSLCASRKSMQHCAAMERQNGRASIGTTGHASDEDEAAKHLPLTQKTSS